MTRINNHLGWSFAKKITPPQQSQKFERFPVPQFLKDFLKYHLQWSWYFRWNSLHHFGGPIVTIASCHVQRRLRERPLHCNRNDFCPTTRRLVPLGRTWRTWSEKWPRHNHTQSISKKMKPSTSTIIYELLYVIQNGWYGGSSLIMHCLMVVSSYSIQICPGRPHVEEAH